MRNHFSRRQVIKHGIGGAGLLMAGRGFAQDFSLKHPDRSKDAPTSPVAIQRCESYEPQVVRARLDKAFNLIGGIGKLVNNKSVAIKINVTGGPGDLGGLPGYRTYHNHPAMLAALCAALTDAGAKRIVILESQYSPKTPEEVLSGGGWDVAKIKEAGAHKVTFEDTRNRSQWKDYSTLKVPWGGFHYPAFMVNQSYEKTDVFISFCKMKDHLSTGITLSAKNLFGMPPTSLYGGDAPNENSLHYRGPILHNGIRAVPAGVPGELQKLPEKDWKRRVPRVTADLVGARPIDLAIVDGVETNRGGEGPWAKGVEPLAPKLLLVGRNPVCTDAIGAVAMGYDPQAGHGQFPFPGENHLLLLASVGVGTLDPNRIEVLGLPLKEAVFPFNSKRVPLDIPTALYSRPCGYSALA